ncbi:MAG: hypothetical protein KGJ86_11390 [Chloroflexota bacterium]|nr:hypothetical protein [Chloroflexota bacterium]
MTLAWVRTINLSNNFEQDGCLLGRLNNGQTYVRVHLRWGAYGDTTDRIDIQGIADNLITFGLVTTIGDTTEPVPPPRTFPNDIDPPTQRWIYWETRQMLPIQVSPDAGVITWKDSGSTEPTDTKGQVLATGLGGGDTLNLWATWQAPFPWDPSGTAQVWLGASVLYKTP